MADDPQKVSAHRSSACRAVQLGGAALFHDLLGSRLLGYPETAERFQRWLHHTPFFYVVKDFFLLFFALTGRIKKRIIPPHEAKHTKIGKDQRREGAF